VTIIIGLLGGAGSGKSLTAKHLVEKYGAKEYSLAGPLKEIARKTLNLSEEQLYGSQKEKETPDPRYGFSPRWFLQRLGTQGIRSVFGEDVWVERVLRTISDDGPYLAVISDVRFTNEARLINKRGTAIWKLENTNALSSADKSHQSEAEINSCVFHDVIRHDGKTLAMLLEKIDALCYLNRITPSRII
jgi:hypothetical protein